MVYLQYFGGLTSCTEYLLGNIILGEKCETEKVKTNHFGAKKKH